MALPFDIEMPSYLIYRDTQPGRSADTLVFCPPKDSDELFDALRAKYPLLKNHSERIREAVLEFFSEEAALNDSLPQTQFSSPQMTDTTCFPTAASSTQSTWSSPETRNLPTPNIGDSPRPLSRQFSVATTATAPSECSPPAMEGMTGVFSLSDSTQPKQRHRRKMTEIEKIEYKKRRIVKACDQCAKRKRKCNHNQQEMASVASKSHKIQRSSATSVAKKPPAPNLQVQIAEPELGLPVDQLGFLNSLESEQSLSLQEFDDFLNAPIPDLAMEDTFAPLQMDWPWADTPDFTLMDTSVASFTPESQNAPGYQFDESPTESFVSTESNEMHDYDITEFINASRQANRMIWEHLRTGQQQYPTQSSESSHIDNEQSTERSSGGEMQQMKAPTYHDWKADDIYDSQRSLTEQHIQEVKMHSNERALGDGRRTTHSQVQQELLNNAALQTANARELEALNNADETNTFSSRRLESRSSGNDVSKHSSHNIHTGLDLAKRKTDGIDASVMVAGDSQERTSWKEANATSQQQPLSLGELGDGIIANTSPTTELFMLRRRIPKALHSIVDRDNVNASSSSTTSASAASSTGMQSRGERVVVNSSQTGIDARRSDGLDTRRDTDIADTAGSPTNATANQQLQIEAGQTLAADFAIPTNGGSNSSQVTLYEDRLSDHVRRRDHFGRQFGAGLQVLSAIAGLGCLLVLLSMLPAHGSNLSMVLLALASASHGTKGSHQSYGYWSEMWGIYVPRLSADKANDLWTQLNTQTSNFLRTREDTSSSTWVKETGMASDRVWWSSGKARARCVRVGA